jgi:hypothetical protein
MARQEVTGRKNNVAKPDGPRAAYTIPEFCVTHRISESMHYKIRAEGLGPREGRALTKVIITFESAAEWRKRIVAEQETAE